MTISDTDKNTQERLIALPSTTFNFWTNHIQFLGR